MLFVDQEQAYDSVNTETQWDSPKTSGTPAKTVRTIKMCTGKTIDEVRFNKHTSDEFQVKTGIWQGDRPVISTVCTRNVYNENAE